MVTLLILLRFVTWLGLARLLRFVKLVILGGW